MKLENIIFKYEEGEEHKRFEIEEYISVIFSDFHLFERLYDVDCSKREEDIKAYLNLLDLEGKKRLLQYN
ncbi:hypothetical protein [Marinisporobacter balticus]|uniref:Uncharacterized protein n=1 Tax=Marinisporobacter balticus TaxID=2018667 RepID=A0A4R2KIM9_9FIRM|nr:hypothetical protein [Marinisporobacter balticus]TCO70396.1 hypothetical protein EV214_12616 [Marinisporobacter balticus]